MRTGRAVRDIFDRWAPAYDECSLQPLYRLAHRVVLDATGSAATRPRRVLDIGCGTGQLLRHVAAATRAELIVGADISLGMLARAPRLDPCRLVAGAAEQLPFADEVFDLVLSTISLRHWADRPAALTEIARVMTPGGALAAVTVLDVDARSALTRWWGRPARRGDLSAVEFCAAGLADVRTRRRGGFGPVPTITLVTAHKPEPALQERKIFPGFTTWRR